MIVENLRETRDAHRDSGFPWRCLRLTEAWTPGPSAGATASVLLSVNEYRPHRLADVPALIRISARLKEQVLDIPEVVGITTALQPLGRITYSLSVWTSEDALRRFTLSSDHRRVMQEYRTRGYLRHIHWWGTHHSVGASMAEATRRLDTGLGRRVGDPRSLWAQRDARRLAATHV